jgi:hypothetical protein
MDEPNRSEVRSVKPLIELVTPDARPHVVCMQLLCGCSDGIMRQVIFDDEKLPKAVLGFIKHRQGGTLQLEAAEAMAVVSREKVEGLRYRMPLPPKGYKWLERSDRRGEFEAVPDELKCGRCAGELFGNFAHKESGKFKCADQLPEPRSVCILDCDSPTLPPSNQERMQCGCVQCRKDLTP